MVRLVVELVILVGIVALMAVGARLAIGGVLLANWPAGAFGAFIFVAGYWCGWIQLDIIHSFWAIRRLKRQRK